MRVALYRRGLVRSATGVRNSPRVQAACDVYRPAAIEQLEILGKSVDVDVLLMAMRLMAMSIIIMAMSIMAMSIMVMMLMTMSSMEQYGAASWP